MNHSKKNKKIIILKTLKRLFCKYSTGIFFLNFPLVINTLSALITLPVVLKNLPIEDYGKWIFVLTLKTWILTLSAMNITSASGRGIARGLNGTFLFAFFARLKLLIPLGAIVLGAGIFLKVFGHHTFSTLLIIMGFYLVFGYLFYTSLNAFLVAKKRFKELCFWNILIFSSSTMGSAVVACLSKNVVLFALFELCGIGILSLIAWLWIVKKNSLIGAYKNGEIDRECVSYGLKLIPVDLISTTGTKISNLVIGPFLGFRNLAFFSMANKLKDKMASIIKSAYPLFYADFSRIEKKKLVGHVSAHLGEIGAFGILLTLVSVAAGWSYIKLFLPETFYRSTIYLAILSLSLPAEMMSIVLCTILDSRFRHKELGLAKIIPNLLNLVLVLVLGYFWQTVGICIALTVGAWVSFGLYYFLTIKKDLAVNLIKKFSFLEAPARRW